MCNWYSLGKTGFTKKHKYPASVKMIRVICTSRISRAIILKAVESKIDGIIIIACNKGECHYKNSSETAKIRIEYTSNFLSNVGYEESRIKFYEVADSSEKLLIRSITEFSNHIKNLGPVQ